MKSYYIFRHGETFATKNNTDYGDQVLSAPMLPESRVFLDKIGTYLQTVINPFCVSSEILRCRQTVAVIAQTLGKEFSFDKRINEYNLETFDNFLIRVSSFYTDMELSHHNNIIICTHGAILSAMKYLLAKNGVQEEDLIDYPDPGILWVIKNGEFKEIFFRS